VTTSNYGDQVCNFFTPTMLRYVNKRLTRSLFLARSMATFEKNKDDASWRSSYNKATRQHYDVFLSHAGKDKCTVTANLYEALVGRGLRTFFDKADLSREYAGEQNSGGGQDRDRGPLRREQRFLQKKWTLHELGIFLERAKKSHVHVLPVFYFSKEFNGFDENAFADLPESERTRLSINSTAYPTTTACKSLTATPHCACRGRRQPRSRGLAEVDVARTTAVGVLTNLHPDVETECAIKAI